MWSRKQLLTSLPVLVAALAMIVLAGFLWGPSSLGFWLVAVFGAGLAAAVILMFRYRNKGNEMVKCSGCGRTMIRSVFERAGGCPRCHATSYVGTGKLA